MLPRFLFWLSIASGVPTLNGRMEPHTAMYIVWQWSTYCIRVPGLSYTRTRRTVHSLPSSLQYKGIRMRQIYNPRTPLSGNECRNSRWPYAAVLCMTEGAISMSGVWLSPMDPAVTLRGGLWLYTATPRAVVNSDMREGILMCYDSASSKVKASTQCWFNAAPPL